MTSSWLFPPQTREVQFDEKWSFVDKKQKNCDPTNPADDHKGDWWDHVAYDPEHHLILTVVPGARSIENAEEFVATAKDRTEGASPRLMTSDEYPADATAIAAAFGVPVTHPTAGSGRRPILPERRLPEDLTYATSTRSARTTVSSRSNADWSSGPHRSWRPRWTPRRCAGRSPPRSWSASTAPTAARMRERRGRHTGSVAEDIPVQ